MKIIIWAISAINIYFGLYFFLNIIRILRSSKYSPTATSVFSFLFLGMGFGSLYLLYKGHSVRFALLLDIGPWILAMLLLFFTMMSSDYK